MHSSYKELELNRAITCYRPSWGAAEFFKHGFETETGVVASHEQEVRAFAEPWKMHCAVFDSTSLKLSLPGILDRVEQLVH